MHRRATLMAAAGSARKAVVRLFGLSGWVVDAGLCRLIIGHRQGMGHCGTTGTPRAGGGPRGHPSRASAPSRCHGVFEGVFVGDVHDVAGLFVELASHGAACDPCGELGEEGALADAAASDDEGELAERDPAVPGVTGGPQPPDALRLDSGGTPYDDLPKPVCFGFGLDETLLSGEGLVPGSTRRLSTPSVSSSACLPAQMRRNRHLPELLRPP